MVYDCFQFFNELDILKLRLHILSDVADRFVISESTVTFSGDHASHEVPDNQNIHPLGSDALL